MERSSVLAVSVNICLPPICICAHGSKWNREDHSFRLSLDLSVCFQMEPSRFQTQPFQGWSVEIFPVQSTVLALPRNKQPDHALTTRTEDVDSTPAATFFPGCSGAPLLPTFRTRRVDATCFACGVFRNSWKSRSFEKTWFSALSTTSSADARVKAAY